MPSKFYLAVYGITGPSTATDFAGDFDVSSYDWEIGADNGGLLYVSLSDVPYALGVSNLYADVNDPSLDASITLSFAGQTIALDNAYVASYADSDGHITVAFSYQGAAETETLLNTDGTSGPSTTATIDTPPSSPPIAITPPALTDLTNGYLSVSGATSQVANSRYPGAFASIGHSLGSAADADGSTILYPLTVTLQLPDAGAVALLADAASGTELPSVTLNETSRAQDNTLVYQIALTGATVTDVQIIDDTVQLTFDYSTIATTSYNPDGSVAATTSASTAGNHFSPPTTLESGKLSNQVFLHVGGLTGPSTEAGFQGDFAVSTFAIDLDLDRSGLIDLTLLQAPYATGVSGLYLDAVEGMPLSSVTLYEADPATGFIRQKMVLSDVYVASYVSAGDTVSVALGYASDTVTATVENANGTAGASTTTRFTTPTSSEAAAVTPSPDTATDALFLSVSGATSDTQNAVFPGAFKLSGYSLGATSATHYVGTSLETGGAALDPLVVTLPIPDTGAGALLADAVAGTVLASVTLRQWNATAGLDQVIALADATVADVQVQSDTMQVTLDYRNIEVTDYAAGVASSTETFTVPSNDSFAAAPTLAGSSLADPAFLGVGGLSGPSIIADFTGDFDVSSYGFDVTAHVSGLLDITFTDAPDASGVIDLFKDALTGALLPRVTLYETDPTHAQIIQRIVLTDAYVASYASSGDTVTVALGYGSATITSDDPNGTTSPATASITQPTSQVPDLPAPTPAASADALYLSVPGITSDVSNGLVPGALTLSAYSLSGMNTDNFDGRFQPGATKFGPLTVTLGLPDAGATDLLTDAADGSVLPSVTLEDFSSMHLAYTIRLTHVTLTLEQQVADMATLTFDYGGIEVTDAATGDSFTEPVCFCPGTLIRTPDGDVPVERLLPGDRVVTLSGAVRPILWVGHGRVHAKPGKRGAATPVLVRKGALADNVPYRDLRITKGHSLWLDGVFIPVEFLINHRSILWEDHVRTVIFHHVELEGHDVLIANGAPSESYRDDANRRLFRNASTAPARPPRPPCAPVLTGGSVVDAHWQRLLDRAGPCRGVNVTDDPDLHLLMDGARIDPIGPPDGVRIFRLPAPPGEARVISNAGVPAELGRARDSRLLGVALRRMTLRNDVTARTLTASDPGWAAGFHPFEPDNGYRWTTGDAVIPRALFEGVAGPSLLELAVAETTVYPLLAA